MQNSLLNLFISIIKDYYYYLFIIFIYIFFKGLLALVPSYAVKVIFDTLSLSHSGVFSYQFFFYLFVYFIFHNCLGIINYFYRRYIFYTFTALLRKKIIDFAVKIMLFKKSSFFFNKNNTELVHYVFHMHEFCIDLVTLLAESILPKCVTLLCAIIVCTMIDYWCTALLILWLLILGFSTYTSCKKFADSSLDVLQSKVGVTKNIMDLLNNIPSVKFFFTYEKEFARVDNSTSLLADGEVAQKKFFIIIDFLYAYSFVLVQIISLIILYAKYYYGIIMVSTMISWWMLFAIIGGIGENLVPEMLTVIKFFFGLIEAVDVLNIQDNETISYMSGFNYQNGLIFFDGVSYEIDGKVIINDLTFAFKPGQKIGIVGFSGSGKTSLLKLILGIHAPTCGTVYIDEQDISKINLSEWHSHCSVVFQNGNLFERTILENIFYGQEEYKLDVMETMIKEDELYDILSLDQLVSHHNHADIAILSGGETQRIHLARALYRKNKQVYIFDEPTSNLDAITESQLMYYIHNMNQEKTIIMVTHKLSLVSNFDVILVFDSGKMIEYGSHDALMAHNGLYKKLYLLDTLV